MQAGIGTTSEGHVIAYTNSASDKELNKLHLRVEVPFSVSNKCLHGVVCALQVECLKRRRSWCSC